MAEAVLTNNGRKILLDRFANTSPTRSILSQFKVGIGTTTPSVTDTDVETPVPLTGTESVDDCEATTGWTDSADMTVSLNTTTFKEADGSLNLTKDGTGSASASTSKTTTSRDFTSKELELWYYVDDTTTLDLHATSNCLTIRFGSDSSNYYQWTVDKASLSTGWNRISGLTSATATVVSSPTITACDYTFIQVTATGSGDTWAAGKVAMDDIKLVSSDDYLRSTESSYPVVDYANFQIEFRARATTVMANGYPLTEVGFLNSDGTPLLGLHCSFNSISKTEEDELIFVVKTTHQN